VLTYFGRNVRFCRGADRAHLVGGCHTNFRQQVLPYTADIVLIAGKFQLKLACSSVIGMGIIYFSQHIFLKKENMPYFYILSRKLMLP
jgi:hypothetical protein